MSAAFGTQAFQQSRHARRIYVGGFPPNYGDEEALKFFLNSIIAKGLGEPNDNSYVLSIYVNQKKCFAFVELRSIELATACLDLDGIIYKKVVLKILRANEYKPELIPPSMMGPPITLDLSMFAFGTPSVTAGSVNEKNPGQGGNAGMNGIQRSGSGDTCNDDARLDSAIQFASLAHVAAGGITIVGYPFDDRAAHSFTPIHKEGAASGSGSGSGSSGSGTTGAGSGGYTGLGCTQAAKKMRNLIRKYKFGMLHNPEYGVDLSQIKFVDIGDVQVGKTREETKQNLTAIVSDIVLKRSVPFVVGGGSDCSYYAAQGVMAAVEGRVGIVVVSAQIDDTRVLEDQRFCSYTVAGDGPTSHSASNVCLLSDAGHEQHQVGGEHDGVQAGASNSPQHAIADCAGRYVRFAAQGSLCTSTQSNSVVQKGGHVVWLGKDIRNQSALCSVLPPDFASEPVTGRSSAHAHTLRLFRESLRCAAGRACGTALLRTEPSVTAVAKAEQKAADTATECDIARQDSQDTITANAVTPKAGLRSQLPRTESGTRINTGAAPAGHADDSHVNAGTEDAAPAVSSQLENLTRPHGVVVSIDMGCMQGSVKGCGYVTGSSASTTGLTVDEILDIAMLAGADPNVLSLDVSEFSPDAEDSRSNMLLAQLFYHFSLGVASRPNAAHQRAAGVLSGIEVESKTGSFVLPDHAHFLPPRLQIDKPAVDLNLASSSRTPKYYQDVGSNSMDVLSGGAPGNSSASTAAGDTRPVTSSSAPPPSQPYVEVDHRLSSMDAMDHGHALSIVTNEVGPSFRPGSASAGRQALSPSSQLYTSSPTSQPSTIGAAYSSSGSTDNFSTRNLYPTSALNPRVPVGPNVEASLLGAGGVRTSPTASGGATPVRRASNTPTGNSPPLPTRVMAKMAPYPTTAPQRPAQLSTSHAALTQQQQHQQMFAQQALMLQQQQAIAQRNQPYRPSAHAVPYVPQAQPTAHQGYPAQRRYEPDLQLLDPDLSPSYGRLNVSQASAGLYERNPEPARYPAPQTAQVHRMPPPPQSAAQGPGMHHQQYPGGPYRYPAPSQQPPQQQQHAQHASLEDPIAPGHSSFMSGEFMDIGGDRMLGGSSRSADTNAYAARKPIGGGGGDLGGGLGAFGNVGSAKGLSGSLSSGTLDVHPFDESLDLLDFRLQPASQQQRALNGVRPPSAALSPAQRTGNISGAGNSSFSLYGAGSSAYSTDSLTFSHANSSLSSELMAGLGGLGSAHSNVSGYGDSIFGHGSGTAFGQPGGQAGGDLSSDQPK